MSIERTGRERSIAELAMTDARNAGQVWISHDGSSAKLIETEDIQAGFLRAESTLGPNVPAKIKERIETARSLAAYGWFCYEFYAVSMFWSLSCIETALRMRFAELHSSVPIIISHKSKGTSAIALNEFRGYYRKGWRMTGLPDFDLSLRAHLNWARDAGMLPSNVDLLYIATLRNSMAHPEDFNWVVPGDHARLIFEQLTATVAGLWP